MMILTDTFSRCLSCHILSWSYDGVCSDTECNNSVGREVSQCVLCGWCVGVAEHSTAVGTHFIHNDDSIGLWGRSLWNSELYKPWSSWQSRHWTRNCVHVYNTRNCWDIYPVISCYIIRIIIHGYYSPSCSVSTVSARSLYGPVPLSLTAATCT